MKWTAIRYGGWNIKLLLSLLHLARLIINCSIIGARPGAAKTPVVGRSHQKTAIPG